MTNATAREILRLTPYTSTTNFPLPGIRSVCSLLSLSSSRLCKVERQSGQRNEIEPTDRARTWCDPKTIVIRNNYFGTFTRGCSSVASQGRRVMRQTSKIIKNTKWLLLKMYVTSQNITKNFRFRLFYYYVWVCLCKI